MPPPPLPAPAAATTAANPLDIATTVFSNPASELTTLRTHIQTLTELNSRLQAIRHIPAQLLRPPGSDPHNLESTLLSHGFKELGTIAETVRSEKVQDGLKAARKSQLADPSNLGSNLRRDSLKRRRPPSPPSPQPYRETESRDLSLLPSVEAGTAPVDLDGLPAYIRSFNQSAVLKAASRAQSGEEYGGRVAPPSMRLYIVAPKKGRKLECPVTLRLIVPNVVTIYLMVDHKSRSDGTLVVENATASGSREQKAPHSQSDFMAFQQLSQQLAKVIRSEPSAPLQAFVMLLSSYEQLFVDACSNCQRVISAEGHVPPVVRRLVRSSAEPRWDVRHVVCKYEPPPPNGNASESGAELLGEGTGGDGGGS
ncbi:hypothetical protein C8Q80DRAFT_1220444 [Daedaleopsis nitida]|nr:hypothetical protein C8Q80DRAFT_1220444 [Daedaleopsis nitida]